MRVLFVCSGNKKDVISPIVYNQGESLKEIGVSIEYFPIIGKGLKGYFKNIKPLFDKIKDGKYDIIHAHYSYHGVFTSLLTRKPVVVSIMGSFPTKNFFYYITRFFVKYIWNITIVKSDNTYKQLRVKKALVIPNGVDLNKFTNSGFDKKALKEELGLNQQYRYILFAADPARKCKNFPLAQDSVNNMNVPKVKLVSVFNKPQSVLIKYMNACNALVLTSSSEGSPNVIKEAMACNCPVISSDVGDARHVIANTTASYVVEKYTVEEFTKCIEMSLNTNDVSNGRERILELGLDRVTIANKLLETYKSLT